MATKDDELLRAVQGNNIQKVTTLLDHHGAARNYFDLTPVKLAIAAGYSKIAVLLIERRYIMPMCDRYALFEQAIMKKLWTVVASLLGLNVNPNVPLSFGDPPLCFATEMRCPELVKVLIEAGANPNSINTRHETALYIACRDGSTVIANLLIQAGADVNGVHTKSNNFTPLITAVANDNCEIVKLLLSHSININAQDTDGWTALWHAYSNCNKEICALLLKACAIADIPNNEGKTIVQEANEDEDDDNFVHLFKKYSKCNTSLSPEAD